MIFLLPVIIYIAVSYYCSCPITGVPIQVCKLICMIPHLIGSDGHFVLLLYINCQYSSSQPSLLRLSQMRQQMQITASSGDIPWKMAEMIQNKQVTDKTVILRRNS